jgi:RDD family
VTNTRTIAVRRSLAFALDWLVVVLWGGILFGAVMIATNGKPPRPENPWVAQAIGLLTVTLPVTLYFAFSECSAWQASLGKRALGLVVSRETGERLSLPSALLRNAVKFVPWECGHTLAQQAVFSGEGGFPAWVWGPAAVAFVGPVWWLVAMFATGRTPYDRWTAARVARSTGPTHHFETAALATQQPVAADGGHKSSERL